MLVASNVWHEQKTQSKWKIGYNAHVAGYISIIWKNDYNDGKYEWEGGKARDHNSKLAVGSTTRSSQCYQTDKPM